MPEQAGARWRFAQQQARETEAAVERLRRIAERNTPPWGSESSAGKILPWPSIWIRRDRPAEERTGSGLTIVRDELVTLPAKRARRNRSDEDVVSDLVAKLHDYCTTQKVNPWEVDERLLSQATSYAYGTLRNLLSVRQIPFSYILMQVWERMGRPDFFRS